MLRFSKPRKNVTILCNNEGVPKNVSIIQMTDKVLCHVLAGNYKPIKKSLPKNSKILEIMVSTTNKGNTVLLHVESKEFDETKPGDKYPVLNLLFEKI